MGGIFIIRGDRELLEMTEQPYESESILQELLQDYPQLLAGKQIDSVKPRRWLLVCREAGIPHGDQEWKVRKIFGLLQLPNLQIHPIFGYRCPVSSGRMQWSDR